MIRFEQGATLFYITTTDRDGRILAWVEGSKFVSLFNQHMIPKAFTTHAEAKEKLKELGKDNDRDWKIRMAVRRVDWSEAK